MYQILYQMFPKYIRFFQNEPYLWRGLWKPAVVEENDQEKSTYRIRSIATFLMIGSRSEEK